MQELINKYLEKRQVLNALDYALYLISWDTETEAPVDCLEERSKHIGTLYTEEMNILFSDEYINLVNELDKNSSKLDDDLKKEIKKVKKDLDQTLLIPKEEQIRMSTLFATSENIWATAKKEKDFSLFKEVLRQIVDYERNVTKYLETKDKKGYDVLLDMYEDDSSVEFYDEFFNTLKKDLVPFVKEVASKKLEFNHDFLNKKYDVEKQKEIAKYFMHVMLLDKNFAVLKESMHPFTTGSGCNEIRITTHYYEDQLLSNIYSVIHESGHGTYEHQVDEKYNNTKLSGGTTMAMHESQSRFYENYIGRSKEFWETHFDFVKNIFKDELKDVTVDDFYKAANEVSLSFVRTEADELTYPLHIMLRYDLEKELISGKLSVDDLETRWNELFKEYFGKDVPSVDLGVLQDVHWAGGSFGYFPTYALGTAYAAQLYHQMRKEIDVDKIIKSNNLREIHDWLKEKVHKFGGSKSPKEILLAATHENFNPKYYVEYLKEKYSKLYNLK